MQISKGLPIPLPTNPSKQLAESSKGELVLTEESKKYMTDSVIQIFKDNLDSIESALNLPYDGNVRDTKYSITVNNELTAVIKHSGLVDIHGPYKRGVGINEGLPTIDDIVNSLIDKYGRKNVSVSEYSLGESPTRQELSGLSISEYEERFIRGKLLLRQDMSDLKESISQEQSKYWVKA